MPKKKRKPSRSELEKEYIDLWQGKVRHQINEHLFDSYVRQSNFGVDSKKQIKRFRRRSRKLRDRLIDLSVESFATVDGGEKVTEVLQNLGFSDAYMDTGELRTLSLLFMRVKIFIEMAQVVKLPKNIQDKMFDRYLARLLPTRDNLPKTSRRSNDPSNSVEQLLQMISADGPQAQNTRKEKGS